MKKMKRFILYSIVLVLFAGCSQNKGVVGGESFTEEGPVLVDATLSLEIINGRPRAITDYFYFNDTVNVYTLWENVKDTNEVSFYFFTPNGDLRDSFLIPLLPGEFSSVFVSYVPPHIEGDWEVAVYLGETFQRSLIFTLARNQGK